MPLEDVDTHQSEAKSVELQVLEPPRKLKRGRPRTFTLRRFIAVCWLVERGYAITGACEIEGISYTIFRQRVAASARLTERVKKATDVRFERRHEEALSIIMAHAQHNWQAAAWWLERNLPASYSLRNVTRPDSSEEPAGEEIPAEVLARHRALLLELAREDEAKQQAKELPAPE